MADNEYFFLNEGSLAALNASVSCGGYSGTDALEFDEWLAAGNDAGATLYEAIESGGDASRKDGSLDPSQVTAV